jgi:peptidoglycan/LPS O-acetylase OafA/YrhL
MAFFFFVSGNGLFGLLTMQGTKLLGTISYSIYLLHAMFLFVVFRWANQFQRVERMHEALFWSLVFLCGIMAVLFSAVSYVLVEHPFVLIAHRRRSARLPKVAPRPARSDEPLLETGPVR